MDHRAALAALKVNVLRAMVFLFRRLVDKAVGGHRLALRQASALRHFVQVAVDGGFVDAHSVFLKERGKFRGRETLVQFCLDELSYQVACFCVV